MGWLYMQSLGGHTGPRQYLDAQFTYERPDHRCRVLQSALVAMRTYYAAVEIVRSGHEREVTALVCLVRYNPRDREGYVFGYKDMDEGMGPCEADCPEAILDLLTPTDRPYAVGWRERCRANAARRREVAAKPSPRPGQTIVFDQPMRFSDGRVLDRFVVAANPRTHRSVYFRDPTSGGLYRIPGVKRRGYQLFDPPRLDRKVASSRPGARAPGLFSWAAPRGRGPPGRGVRAGGRERARPGAHRPRSRSPSHAAIRPR